MFNRRFAAIAAIAVAVIPAASAQAAKPNIVELAAGDKRFDTLVELVERAGLAETLSGGSFTVFAPTDKAFSKVPKKTLKALAKDKKALKSVLLYHVVEGRVPAKKVVKLDSAKTLNGAKVSIEVRGKNVFLDKTRKVVQTDVKASNGIIHAINGVLIPAK